MLIIGNTVQPTLPCWVVPTTGSLSIVGLAYGGAIMVEQMQLKKLTQKEGHLLNHHLAVSHSLLEDTVIFVAIGIPALWILGTRLLFAIAVVWGRRLYNFIYSRNVIKRPLEG